MGGMMRTTRQEFAAYIGIDWADQKHDISLSTSMDGKTDYKRISSAPDQRHLLNGYLNFVSVFQKVK